MRFLTFLFLLTSIATAQRPAAPLPVLDGKQTSSGELVGQVDFGGRRVRAMFHKVGGVWALALRTGAQRLSDLAPAVRGTVVDGLGLSAPVLVFSDGRTRVRLNAEARAFYGVDTLDLERGINIVSVATPGAAMQKTLGLVGLRLPRVVLTGVILRDFDRDALSQAKQDGKLAQALRRGTMLKASIPNFKMRLPRGMSAGSGYLYVTGEPGIGVGFSMTMNGRLFDARLGLRKTELGATEMSIYAAAKGRWSNAFGIKGFHLDETRLVMSLDAAQRFGVGLKASMAIGRRKLSVGGKILLHAVTGAPLGGAFEGSIDKLTTNDIVALLNARSRRKIPAPDLPAFEIRNAYLRVAPGGGDPALGIKSGFGISGRLYSFGRLLASVRGEMDERPMLALAGRVSRFDLGAVALRNAVLEVNMGAVKNPYFRFRGSGRILNFDGSLAISSSRTHYMFATSQKVGGIYDADWRYSTRVGIRPSWSFSAYFKNRFSRTLEQNVSRKALAWASKVKRDYGAAQRKLDGARREVARLDQLIRRERAKVYADRKAKWAKIQAIKNRIAWLNGEISKRESKLNGLRAYVRKLKVARDRAYRAWKKAVRDRKRAPLHKKPKYKAIEAKKWAAYQSAKGAYNAANKNLVKWARALDPKLNAYRAERTTATASYRTQSAVYSRIMRTPVDLAPRVARVIVAKKTADGALRAAKKIVGATGNMMQGAGRMTAWAARNNGKILMLDEARMSGKLDGWIRGSRIELRMKVRVMGKPRTIRLAVSARDITSGRVFTSLWNIVKK